MSRLLIVEADTDQLTDGDSVMNLLPKGLYITLSLDTVKLLQQEACFPWTTIDLMDRVRLALGTYSDANVARLLLGPGRLHARYFEVQAYASGSHNLFRHVARMIGQQAIKIGQQAKIEDASWQAFLKEAIGLKAHFATYEQSLSPLASFLHGLDLNHTKIGLSEQPQLHWLQSLQRAGANLVEYGRLEKRIVKTSNNPVRLWLRGYFIDLYIINFAYGSEPEDWNVWFSWPLDEWAGEFWHMIENPELFDIPGAWLSD